MLPDGMVQPARLVEDDCETFRLERAIRSPSEISELVTGSA
jgi:hypothetical protein